MYLISANHAHHGNNKKWFSVTSFSTGSGFILLSNSNYQFLEQTLSIKTKQNWITTVIYRILILKTQCTQNGFTLKYFDLVCFIFLIPFNLSVLRITKIAILSDKAQFRYFNTSSESRKFLFKPKYSASCPACGHIITDETRSCKWADCTRCDLWSHF